MREVSSWLEYAGIIFLQRLHGEASAAQAATQLDQEQQDLVKQLVQEPGCIHSIWSPPGGGKSFVLAALLASWATRAAPHALACYVTNRKNTESPCCSSCGVLCNLTKSTFWLVRWRILMQMSTYKHG